MAQAKKKQEQAAIEETKTEVAEAQVDVDMDVQGATNVPAEDAVSVDGADSDTKFTKAGKHSKKSTEATEAEEARKAAASERKDEGDKPKKPAHSFNPAVLHGKKYREALGLVDRHKQYDLTEGIALTKKTSTAKFDAAIELHINLGVDPRQADQMVRSSVVLPAGTGRSIKVAVLAGADKHEAAKKAGADLVGDDDLIAKIDKGELSFDMLIATPDMMPKLGKLAKVLGPKGLMPNPKSGTVTPDVAKAVTEAKTGKVEFRIDKQGILHQSIGKVSFSDKDIAANTIAFVDAVLKVKPSGAKGTYVKAMTLASSMGPGIKLSPQSIIAEVASKR